MVEMVYCPKCGIENVDDAKFCVNCGAEIVRISDKRIQSQRMIEKDKIQRRVKKENKHSLKSVLSNTTFVATIIILVAIICFSLGFLFGDLYSEENKDNNKGNSIVTIDAQQFRSMVNISADPSNLTCIGNIAIADAGDTLQVTGTIDELEVKHDNYVGEYTTIVLDTSGGMGLAVYGMGNITNKYHIGDEIQIKTHIISCQGHYTDLYGREWTLSGEFMKEEFIDGEFAFELVIPQNQIEKI